MTKYIVAVPEVWIQNLEVEADSPEEALKKCIYDNDGEILEDEFEYSYTLDDIDQFNVYDQNRLLLYLDMKEDE